MRRLIIVVLVSILSSSISYTQTLEEIQLWAENQKERIYKEDSVGFLESTGFLNGIAYTDKYAFNSSFTGGKVAVELSAEKFIIVFNDSLNNTYGQVVLGTVFGDSISFSSKYLFDAGYTGYFSAIGMDENRFVISWCDGYGPGAGLHRMKSVVGEVVGDSIAFGPVSEHGNGRHWISTAKLDSTHFVLVGRMNGGGAAIIGELNGDIISFGPSYEFDPDINVSYFVAAMSPTKIVIVYNDGNYFYDPGVAIIGTISNGSISFGDKYAFCNDPAAYFRVANLDTNTFVITYPLYDSISNGTACIGTANGNVISFGDQYSFGQVTNWNYRALKLDTEHFHLASNNFYDTINHGDSYIATVIGDSISYSPSYWFYNGFCNGMSSILLDEHRFVTAFSDFTIPYSGGAVIGAYNSYNIETILDSMDICSGEFSVPIRIKNLHDAVESSIQLSYDTLLLTFNGYQNFSANITYDSMSVDEYNGLIDIYWHASAPVDLTSDTLVELLFNSVNIYYQTGTSITISDTNSYYLDSLGLALEADYFSGIIDIGPIPEPAVFIAGTDSVCQGTMNVVYAINAISNTNSYSWYLEPDSAGTIFGNDTTIAIDFAPDFFGLASVKVYGLNDCGSGDTAAYPVQVIGFPIANAGSDASICENITYTLNGLALNAGTTVWSSSGDGTFDDPFLLNASYTPGQGDISNGSVYLKLHAFAIDPCIYAAADEMKLTIWPLPDQPPIPMGPSFISPDTMPSTTYYINSIHNSTSYEWELGPLDAGTISTYDTLAIVDWNLNYNGLLAYVHVEAINSCGGRLSDTLIVNISPVGLEIPHEIEEQIFIYPNPSEGVFNINILSENEAFDLCVSNANGDVIQQRKIIVSASDVTFKLNLSSHPSGIYYLQFTSQGSSLLKKILVNRNY